MLVEREIDEHAGAAGGAGLGSGTEQQDGAAADPARLGCARGERHAQRHDREQIAHHQEVEDQVAEQYGQHLPVGDLMVPVAQQPAGQVAQIVREEGEEGEGDEHGADRPVQADIMIGVGPARDDRHDLARCLLFGLHHGGRDEVMIAFAELYRLHQLPPAPPPPKLPPPPEKPPPSPPPQPPPPLPQPEPPPLPHPLSDGPQMMTGPAPPR